MNFCRLRAPSEQFNRVPCSVHQQFNSSGTVEQWGSEVSDSLSLDKDVTALGSSKRKPLSVYRSHGEIGLRIPPESEKDVFEFVRYMLARQLIG